MSRRTDKRLIKSNCADLAPIGRMLRIGGIAYLPRVAAMTARIETNLFFEQGLYLMLFASSAGGL